MKPASGWMGVAGVMALETFVRIRAQVPDLLHESVDDGRQLLPFVQRELCQLEPLAFQLQPLQRFLYVFQTALSQLTSLGEVALVIVAIFAAHDDHAVEAARKRIGDPHDVEGTQAAQR